MTIGTGSPKMTALLEKFPPRSELRFDTTKAWDFPEEEDYKLRLFGPCHIEPKMDRKDFSDSLKTLIRVAGEEDAEYTENLTKFFEMVGEDAPILLMSKDDIGVLDKNGN